MKRKVAIIGCGLRARAYLKDVPEEFRGDLELKAVADPDADNRSFFLGQFANGQSVREYSDWKEMLADTEMDALIISSPNYLHAEQLVAAMSRGIPILIEKPVAISLEECRRVWEAYLSSSRPTILVGFVLRFVPFYRRVIEIASSGELGQILQVDADEPLNAGMTSGFFRQGWCLHDRYSGGLLVEKCCTTSIFSRCWRPAGPKVFFLSRRGPISSRARAGNSILASTRRTPARWDSLTAIRT